MQAPRRKTKEETPFTPLSRSEERALLRKDDATFSHTQRYLVPLVRVALDYFVLAPAQVRKLRSALLRDVPVAARRFLEHEGVKKSYKFSTYFSWYIAQRVNGVPNLKRKTYR